MPAGKVAWQQHVFFPVEQLQVGSGSALCTCPMLFVDMCVLAGSRMLPYVVLKGAGVAIGRGKEALWAIGGASSATHSTHGTPRTCLASGNDKHLTEVLKRNLGFVEVADGRVSRLHCIISLGPAAGGHPHLEDCSSNGTFLNHRKLAKGESGGQRGSWAAGVACTWECCKGACAASPNPAHIVLWAVATACRQPASLHYATL